MTIYLQPLNSHSKFSVVGNEKWNITVIYYVHKGQHIAQWACSVALACFWFIKTQLDGNSNRLKVVRGKEFHSTILRLIAGSSPPRYYLFAAQDPPNTFLWGFNSKPRVFKKAWRERRERLILRRWKTIHLVFFLFYIMLYDWNDRNIKAISTYIRPGEKKQQKRTWRSWIRESWYNYENNQQEALHRFIYYFKSPLYVLGEVLKAKSDKIILLLNITVFIVFDTINTVIWVACFRASWFNE
jgi:hypothetical protein